MTPLKVGQVVRLRESVDGLPKGTVARVVVVETKASPPLIQAAKGTKMADGDVFGGHTGDHNEVRSRGWYAPRHALRLTRDTVSSSREFDQKYAVRG